jgi:hypothetical protein
MAAGQRHPGPAVLVERRRVRPRGRGVAVGARAVVAPGVRIAVTAVAAARRLRAPGVTAGARDLDVGAAQRKAGAIVIEAGGAGGRRELPAARGVARRAVEIVDDAVVRGLVAHREVGRRGRGDDRRRRERERDAHRDPRAAHGTSACGLAWQSLQRR